MSSKILVFSDSHGRAYNMQRAVSLHGATVSYIIHLGDGVRDLDYIDTSAQLLSVCGNCDSRLFGDTPRQLFIDIDGRRLLLSHGHDYFVKSTYSVYEEYAGQKGADLALFGHTHIKHSSYRDGLYLFNPGSISRPADGEYSYGVIEISDTGILLSHGTVS